MKKIVLLAFVSTLAFGVAAYAQMGPGCWSNGTQVTSSAQAEDIVGGIIAAQGGSAVIGSNEIKLRRGTGYKVAVRNAQGSTEYYVVTPFGYTRGPLTSEIADNFCNYHNGYGMMGHGYGHGMRHGYNMGYDCGMMMGNNNGNYQPTVTTTSQAEEIVKQAISGLKGYSIVSSEEVPVRMGTAYKVNVKDGADNILYYFVSPFGIARGPLSNSMQGY